MINDVDFIIIVIGFHFIQIPYLGCILMVIHSTEKSGIVGRYDAAEMLRISISIAWAMILFWLP